MNSPSLIIEGTGRPTPARLLVRGVNWLGDAVMTTPALLRLRERFPQTQIALLTPARIASIWERHPAVNEVIAFAPGEGVFSVARRLRARRFDLALVLPNSPRSALESFLARIPARVGYARPWRTWMLTHSVPERAGFAPMRKRSPAEVRALLADSSVRGGAPEIPKSAHHLHHYLHLTAALGANPQPVAPTIAVADHEVAAMRTRFGVGAAVGGAKPLFGFNAGAEYGPAKRWPVERFVETAVRLHERTGGHAWIFGGPDDQELAGQLAAGIRAARPEAANAVSVLAGQTSLRELCAALRACDAVLTNDTGPMHLAAAVGTRVVALFGSTSPELTGPGLPGDERALVLRGMAPCAPCFLRDCPVDFRCMTSLSVDRVVEAMLRKAEGAEN